MSSTLIIDRIEGDFAIMECGEYTFEIPISAIPEGSKEGDHLILSFSAPTESDTEKEAKDRLERLKTRDSGDDIIDL